MLDGSSQASPIAGRVSPYTASANSAAMRPAELRDDLLLRETHHRCSNDLQLVVSLLSLQSRRATSLEAREALADATSRVVVLARARRELDRQRQPSLETALRQVCEALGSQAEPSSILMSLEVEPDIGVFGSQQIAALALAVNELATNAIKHAFAEGASGRISIAVRRNGTGNVVITVDDDGLPFPEPRVAKSGGMGLGLVKRLVASIDGLLIPPPNGSKVFEIRMPA